MRLLKKNQQPLYYSTYAGQQTIYKRDENGEIIYADEEKKVPIEIGVRAGYNNPVLFHANISAGEGSEKEDVFGKDVDYTRTISTSDLTLPIDELSIVWIESKPVYLEDGSADPNSADYKVAARPAKSLNQLMIALKALPKGSV